MDQENKLSNSYYDETMKTMKEQQYKNYTDAKLEAIAENNRIARANKDLRVIKKSENKKPFHKTKIIAISALALLITSGSYACVAEMTDVIENENEYNKQVSKPYVEQLKEQERVEQLAEDIRQYYEEENLKFNTFTEEQNEIKTL